MMKYFLFTVNYGCLLLEALLRNCPFVNPTQQQQSSSLNSNEKKENTIKISDHTPITFSEIAGRTLYRVEYKDIGRESEQQSLTSVLPMWIIDPLTNVNLLLTILNILEFSGFCFVF